MSVINMLGINCFYFVCHASVLWQAQISATYDVLFEVSSPFFHLLFIIVIDFLVQVLYFHFDLFFHCSDLLFLCFSLFLGYLVVL